MLYVLAENIRSAYNIGSIFRTADGAGFDKVILAGFSPVPDWNPQAGQRPYHYSERSARQISKTALEAEKYVAWEYWPDSFKAITELKKQGFLVVALENNVPGTKNLFEFKRPAGKDLCVCVGNEVEGLSRAILEAADIILSIPMKGKKESLNVAVAFGVAAYFLSYSWNKG